METKSRTNTIIFFGVIIALLIALIYMDVKSGEFELKNIQYQEKESKYLDSLVQYKASILTLEKRIENKKQNLKEVIIRYEQIDKQDKESQHLLHGSIVELDSFWGAYH